VFCCPDGEQRYCLGGADNLLSIIDVCDQEHLLRELREIRKALDVSAELETVPRLGRGKRVRITAGPFRGIAGTVWQVRSHFRVLLNATMIGRSVPLEVDAGAVELMS